jgi:hypothetical protein
MSVPRMTPRQRVLIALEHREPDRVPIEYFFFGTPEMVGRLKAHLRCETDEASPARVSAYLTTIGRYVR